MVDFHTYKQLHSDSAAFRREYESIDNPNVKRMDLSIMEAEGPPPYPDLYAFPRTLTGYNLRSKKWGRQ
jgi:hypothetical protein